MDTINGINGKPEVLYEEKAALSVDDSEELAVFKRRKAELESQIKKVNQPDYTELFNASGKLNAIRKRLVSERDMLLRRINELTTHFNHEWPQDRVNHYYFYESEKSLVWKEFNSLWNDSYNDYLAVAAKYPEPKH